MGESGRSAGLPLSERMRPVHLDDLAGNPRARAELRSWAEGWTRAGPPPARRAAILSGPPGVGKTSAALALAADLRWGVVEMNASDARNADAIQKVAGRAAGLRTLSEGPFDPVHQRTLIVLDEADCLTGRLGEQARKAPSPIGWREYLLGRYGTVDALNVTWGLGRAGAPAPFEGWEAVPRVPGNHRWTALAPAQRDLADWRGSSRKVDLSDRGGIGVIAELVRTTRQPLLLIVNDERELTRHSAALRTGVARIRFYPIPDVDVRTCISRIARREGLAIDGRAIESIVHRAHGDLRAALNDVDAVSPLPPGPAQMNVLGNRDVGADLAFVTEEALTQARFYRSTEVRDRADATPEDLFPWIEENLPRFSVDAAHRAAAYVPLAHADLYLNRARRWRNYGLWSYASELMTGGVGVRVRDRPGTSAGPAHFPEFLGEMGRSRGARALRESIAAKYGGAFHLSREKVREVGLPFLEDFFRPAPTGPAGASQRNTQRSVVRDLELTPEEIAFLRRVEPESRAVEELLKPDEDEPRAKSGPARPATTSPAPPARRDSQRSLGDF
ncbi:MAG: AAA family ATPase [Thermoplasmata archaeon]